MLDTAYDETALLREPMVRSGDAQELFRSKPDRQPLDEYNFEHFRTRHLAYDGGATIQVKGIKPGEMAPDFELPRADGGTLRLSSLRGRPVLLHFGSYT